MTKTFHPEIITRLEYAQRRIEVEERIIREYVTVGRQAGLSWTQIGDALGITKQTAYARYGKEQPAAKPEAPSTEASDRAALGKIASKISDTDVAGTSETPSIFSDAPAPATAKAEAIHGSRTVAVFTEFAANQPKRNAAQRQHGRIIEEPYEGMARPGTGKGPHLCKGCGCNNHHGAERGTVYWNDGCKPTKYDTAEETEFLNLVYVDPTK